MSEKSAQPVFVSGQMEVDPMTGRIVGFRVVAPDDMSLPQEIVLETEKAGGLYDQPTVGELIREQNYVPMTLSEIFGKSSELFESEEDRQNFCHAVVEAKK
ncbi:MAG: hypothetical protein FWH27_07145 [Planctomycetaceae bacterium]|nr:hypothetical protein [Planctomycetaceae bacterium]